MPLATAFRPTTASLIVIVIVATQNTATTRRCTCSSSAGSRSCNVSLPSNGATGEPPQVQGQVGRRRGVPKRQRAQGRARRLEEADEVSLSSLKALLKTFSLVLIAQQVE